MITFKSISMKNFMSYGNVPTVVFLDRPGTTLILGENLDNTTSGTGSNGVGKTTVINALAYALYDSPISKISKDNLINNVNGKNMEVIVNFEKDGTDYVVVRARKAGAEGNFTKLLINGVDKTNAGLSVNKEIEKILGIPFDLFVRIATFTADLVAFFDLPSRHATGTNQTDLIEELFNLKTLSEKAEVLKDRMGDTEQSMAANVAKIDALKTEHERHTARITNQQGRIDTWDVQRERDLKQFDTDLNKIKNIDIDDQRERNQKRTEVELQLREKRLKQQELKNEISKITLERDKSIHEVSVIRTNLKKIEGIDVEQQHALSIEANEFSGKLRDVQLKQQGIEKEIKTFAKDTKTVEQELSQLNDSKCPYCKQRYESESKIEELKAKQLTLEKSLEEKSASLATIDEEVDSLTKKVAEIRKQIVVTNFNELLAIKKEVSSYQSKLESLSTAIGDLDSRIQEKEADLSSVATAVTDLTKEFNSYVGLYTVAELLDIKSKIDMYTQKLLDLENATNPHVDALKELQAQELAPVDMSIVNELQNTIDHQKFLLKLLTKKDSFVRKALLNKSIPYLNQRLAYYLTELGLPHTVVFTEEMSAQISEFGKELDFGNLSKGQRARVNIALSFAFRDVYQSMSNQINICMLDEVLDHGLDGVGVQLAARMLKRKARDEKISMFIVSHREEIDSTFDRKMIVQMSNRFSYVKFEEG